MTKGAWLISGTNNCRVGYENIILIPAVYIILSKITVRLGGSRGARQRSKYDPAGVLQNQRESK